MASQTAKEAGLPISLYVLLSKMQAESSNAFQIYLPFVSQLFVSVCITPTSYTVEITELLYWN